MSLEDEKLAQRHDTRAQEMRHLNAISALGERIFTAGYVGRDPQRLLRIAQTLDAAVVDIRLKPRSRAPQWQRDALARLLGVRYTLCSRLGNLNYSTGGPVAIRDLDAGLVYLLEGLTLFPRLILLCACREPEGCHRTVVARALADRHGIHARELDWGAD